MGSRRAPAPVAIVVLLAVLLISATSALAVLAQTGSPPGSDAQTIAHGVDTLPGAPVTWRLGIVTAQAGSEAMFGNFDTGFAIGWQQPVVVTQLPSGESAYLEPGQAVFHAGNSMMRVASATTVDEGFVYIDLTTDSPDPGASFIGTAFTAPSGTHAVRLTSDVMQAGESGSFVPENDQPYLLYVHDGALQVTDANGTVTSLMTDDALQLSGDASFLTGATAGARWMIASIGPHVTVPPLPTPVATATPIPTLTPVSTPMTVGAIVFTLHECPEGSDPLVDASVCAPATFFWDMTLSLQGSNDPTLDFRLSEGGSQLEPNVWVAPQMASGVWVIQPDLAGANYTMRVEMTGDIVPLGGIWGVTVKGGSDSMVDVYLIGALPTVQTGDLVIEMYDCPPGTDPLADPSACTLATDVPNVEVSRITQSEMIVYNTAWDAVSSEAGVFVLEDIESGLFLLIPEDGGLWSADAIVMGGDAFWDHGFWEVSVPVDGSSVYVPIYHTPADPPEPTEVTDISQGIGQLWITQVDCPAGTGDPLSEPGCYPSEAPWEVIVTNADTGETWSLNENATMAITGSWEFSLPAGNYLIDVYADSSWQVIYETFATVTDGGLTEVVVYSIAP